MQPRDVLAVVRRSFEPRDDFIECHRRRIDDLRIGWAMGQQRGGHERTGKRQTGERAIRSRPRTVMRSGAPGPAPMKCTVIPSLLPIGRLRLSRCR